jgi:hypothetical protein
MSDEIHVDDVGTVFTVTLKESGSAVNVSTATTKQIKFKNPAGTSATKTADFTTDGSDGKITYTTVAEDIDSAGVWIIQARIVMPTGTWSSNTKEFRVYPNL